MRCIISPQAADAIMTYPGAGSVSRMCAHAEEGATRMVSFGGLRKVVARRVCCPPRTGALVPCRARSLCRNTRRLATMYLVDELIRRDGEPRCFVHLGVLHHDRGCYCGAAKVLVSALLRGDVLHKRSTGSPES